MDNVLAFGLAVSAAAYFLLGARLVASKREIGSVPLGVLFVVIGLWVAGGAVELAAETYRLFSIGRTGHFIGTSLLPVAAYVAFREYTGLETPTRTIVLLMIVPVVSVTLAATNDYHEFLWHLPSVNAAGEFLTRPAQWGPWFLYVHAPYSYGVIVLALLTLLARRSAVAPAHRRGLMVLIGACIGPIAATLAYDFGIGPDTVPFVPFVFALMLPIYAWLIIGERVVEFGPLAYETVFQNMQDPVIVIDSERRIIGLNRIAESMLGITEREALRTPIDDLLGPGSTGVFEAITTGRPQKLMTQTGRFLHVQASPITNAANSSRGGRVLMFRDVSDVERAQIEVRKSEKLLRTLIDHSVNGIVRLRWVQDEESGARELRCIFANAAACRFLSAGENELVDALVDDVLRHATSGMDGEDAARVLDEFHAALVDGSKLDMEIVARHGAAMRWLRLISEPVGDDIAATFVDVTDGKAKERQMESIAWSDPLTGVLNRRGFERDAAKRLTESADDATGALLFIDLNEFKQINDSCGHEIGDQLLTIAADRLRRSLRPGDIIGRPGGDEFVALVPDVTADVAERLAKRLTVALEEPYRIGAETLRCAASIGLALYPENANTLTGLLREADQAMYRAKARTRGAASVHRDDLLEKAM